MESTISRIYVSRNKVQNTLVLPIRNKPDGPHHHFSAILVFAILLSRKKSLSVTYQRMFLRLLLVMILAEFSLLGSRAAFHSFRPSSTKDLQTFSMRGIGLGLFRFQIDLIFETDAAPWCMRT